MLRPMSASSPPPSPRAVFAAPSLEGARLALRELLPDGARPHATPQCAVAIEVRNADGILLQRALAHADVPKPVRDALRDLVDRHVARFAEAQALDRAQGSAYRGGIVASNDFAGFPVGYAAAVARDRVASLRARLREAMDLDVRLFAVPFLVVHGAVGDEEEVVILRKEDGAYVYEPIVS
jgi:hypothetical protein